MTIGNSNNYKIFSNNCAVVSNPLIIQNTGNTRCWGKRGCVTRDIYGNQRVVQTLLSTIPEWAHPQDKEKIKKFYEDIVLQDLSLARQHIYLIRLKLLSKKLNKPVTQLDYNDVRRLIFNLKQAQTPPATIKLYLETIKKFYKTTLKKKPPIKDIKIHIPHNYPKLLLDEDDIIKLTNHAANHRDKAILQTLWETGCRVGELLNCRVEDIDFVNQTMYLDGKTGKRVVPVLSCLPWIRQYISLYALQRNDYLWKEIGKNNPMQYDNVRMQLRKIAKRAGITKPVNAHNFRHSRATFCAQFMNESLLKQYFGWAQASDTPSTYIHLSGKDLQKSILIINGFAPQKPVISKLAPKQCTCGTLNTYEEKECVKCKILLQNHPSIP